MGAGIPFLISLLAASPQETFWTDTHVAGFTQDGGAVLWTMLLRGDEPQMFVAVVTDSDGRRLSAFRRELSVAPKDLSPEERRFWEQASPEEEEERWAAEHPLAPLTLQDVPFVGEQAIPEGGEPLVLNVLSNGQRCPTYLLIARRGSRSGVVAEDACREGEERSTKVAGRLSAAWSPDRGRAAVAWNVVREPPPGLEAQDWASPTRGYRVIISSRTLASIDLLDAGAGKKLDALADKLAHAKFRVGHRGKAGTPRKKTEIYFAPGFEPEAKELVKLLGLPDAAAQPLTWKTPYSITVAAGG